MQLAEAMPTGLTGVLLTGHAVYGACSLLPQNSHARQGRPWEQPTGPALPRVLAAGGTQSDRVTLPSMPPRMSRKRPQSAACVRAADVYGLRVVRLQHDTVLSCCSLVA